MANTRPVIFPGLLIGIWLTGCTGALLDEKNSPTADQLARKQQSEQRLQAEKVPVNPDLPFTIDEKNLRLRSETEVENRALCLMVVAAKAEGLDLKVLEAIIREYELRPHFTPLEQKFMFGPEVTEYDLINAKWRYESAWTLLWSLGVIKTLSRPDKVADVPRMVKIMTAMNAEAYREDAQLRPRRELLDAADLIYRYDQAAFESRSRGKKAPADLNASVVYERLYAFQWLTRDRGLTWDELALAADANFDLTDKSAGPPR